MPLEVLILTGGSYVLPLLSSHLHLCLQLYHSLSFIHQFCVKKLSTCPGYMGVTGHHLQMTAPCVGCEGPQGLFQVQLSAVADTQTYSEM